MSRNFLKLLSNRSFNILAARTTTRSQLLLTRTTTIQNECFQSTTTSSGHDVEVDESQIDQNAAKNLFQKPFTNVSTFSYRCTIHDPMRHDVEHEGKFYRIDEKDMKIIDPFQENLRDEYYAECKAFNETGLMIRKPALEIMSNLKSFEKSSPARKFIIYGDQEGTGKRCILFHVLHYCHKDNWLVINLPNCSSVLRFERDKQESNYKEGRWDTPTEAVQFIKRFSIQNMDLLKKLNLKTTKTYNWGGRDSTAEGTPLIDLFEYAQSKAKYSSDICAAIVREVKLQSKNNQYKVLVTFDQINSYFGATRLKKSDRTEINVDDVTIARSFKKLLDKDWTNAAIVGIVNSAGVINPAPNRRRKFYDTTIPWSMRRRVECTLHYEGPLTPDALLNEQAKLYLEPFSSVQVPIYSLQEATNHYEYYKDRHWIQAADAKTDDGKQELFFLSGRNPAQFMRVCQTI